MLPAYHGLKSGPGLTERTGQVYVQSSRPERFNIKLALQRLLAGEPPEVIFGVPVSPILSEVDLGRDYTVRVHPEDTIKKPIVNTLRAAATTTINARLSREKVLGAKTLISKPVGRDELTILQLKSQVVFDKIDPIAQELLVSPNPQSNFEIALARLAGYINLPEEDRIKKAREIEITRVVGETLTRNLTPAFLELIWCVYKRDYARFVNLSEELSYGSFNELVFNSLGIVFSLAKGTTAGLAAERTTAGVDHIYEALKIPDNFELVEQEKDSGHFFVRRKSDYQSRVDEELDENYKNPIYSQTRRTMCPAMVDIPDTSSGEAPQANLIHTVFDLTMGQENS